MMTQQCVFSGVQQGHIYCGVS